METSTKTYTGTCYIGVAGSELEHSISRDSIEQIVRRNGDELIFARATKGYESRQKHINNFIASRHDFLLFLDADMTFGPGTLERLRSHQLPYVSGLYMLRKFAPMQPIWFKPYDGHWPISPWVADYARNQLHPIGASGWGCVLVHRDVILAVRALLKGEWEVLEDDMDIWPYDLTAVMQAIAGLRALVTDKPRPSTLMPALAYHLATLESEIRPLRADREIVGSDIRFPFFALQAGYQLMGDPEVRCGHVVDYPLNPDDFSLTPPELQAEWTASADSYIAGEQARMDAIRAALP